jgi:DNA polymerase III sliding clamp (beta) subunit (PCNA family)
MLNALKFVRGAVAAKDFVPALGHFRIQNGLVKGYNGALALCGPIDLDLSVTPKALPFIKAIQACQDTIALHVTDTGRLSIKSGRFKAFVDCIQEEFPDIQPEGDAIKLDGELLKVLKKLAPFIAEDASRPWARGILFRGQSAYATNNVVIIEHWLGYTFPVEINLPKSAVAELLRINEEPESMQVTANSVTFHFSNRRWLRSQTYSLDWPDIAKVLDREATPGEFPEALFTSIHDCLIPFLEEDGGIYFKDDGSIATSHADGLGASVQFEPFGAKGKYNAEQMMLLDGVAERIDLGSFPAPSLFYGDKVRGAIVGMRSV